MIDKRLIIGFISVTVGMLFCSYAYATGGKIIDESKKAEEVSNMKTLKIRWQRLISDGQTCPRCGSTEEELKKTISTLEQSLAPLGIEVVLEKDELSVAEFKKDPLQSNKIWLNDLLLEDWIGGKVGQSPCCDVCGPSECRTFEVGTETYEAIPEKLIVKAGLIAASELLGTESNKSSCKGETSIERPSKGCCPK